MTELVLAELVLAELGLAHSQFLVQMQQIGHQRLALIPHRQQQLDRLLQQSFVALRPQVMGFRYQLYLWKLQVAAHREQLDRLLTLTNE